MGPELEKRFAARAGEVEHMPGFEEFMLLRPVEGESATSSSRDGRARRRSRTGAPAASSSTSTPTPTTTTGRAPPSRSTPSPPARRSSNSRSCPSPRPRSLRARGTHRPEVRRDLGRRSRPDAGGGRPRRLHQAARQRRRGRGVRDGQVDRQPDQARQRGVDHPAGPRARHAAHHRRARVDGAAVHGARRASGRRR
jgi:hypothetical protein